MPNKSKRLNFKCWNPGCGRTYSLLPAHYQNKKFFIACPFCEKEAVVDLRLYESKTTNVFKGEEGAGIPDLDLPAVLSTQKPPPAD